MNLVHNWKTPAIVPHTRINKMKLSQKDLITENMKPIFDELQKKQHVATVKGQFRHYFETAAAEPVRCYELNDTMIETLLNETVGDMKPSELKVKVNDSTLGKLNKYLNQLRTFVAEEMDAKISGEEVIHDRIAFAGNNWKPLLQLRDKWAAEASCWLVSYGQLKRAYDREVEATRAAEARAAVLARRGTNADGDEPPAKRMRVRIPQAAKESNPGSLTVAIGDTCIFVETMTNPRWARVKMDDDGRVGLVSSGRLEDMPQDAEMEDPSDDDEAAAAAGVGPSAAAQAPRPQRVEDDGAAALPDMNMVRKEVAIIFECEESFTLSEFCETSDDLEAFERDAVAEVLSLLAQEVPPVVIITSPLNYAKPPAIEP